MDPCLPVSPPPVTDYRSESLPAYLSNGVIGMRLGKYPHAGARCCVNGFAGTDPLERVQCIQYAPYPLALDFAVNQHWLSQCPDTRTFIRQEYDFSCGELTSAYSFSLGGVTVHVSSLALCCRSLPNFALQDTTIWVESDTWLTLRAYIDTASVPGRLLLRDTVMEPGQDYMDGSVLWESQGGLTTVGAVFKSEFAGLCEVPVLRHVRGYANPIITDYCMQAKAGERYRLRQIAALVPSVMHSEPDLQAMRLMGLGLKRGFDTLRSENREKWGDIWRGRIRIDADDPKWQSMADAAYFYLHTSAHECSPCSTGLFGLGMWHNYHYFKGHVFWDIETFTLPTLLLTAPETARSLLEYRRERLGAAQRNARMSGYRGAMYPWESSVFGEEVTPAGWPHIFHEQHINMDIAFAMAQYAHATGDPVFLREQAWPVVSEICRWIESRVTATPRGYELLHVTGIDEGADYVDNNSWTNCGAVMALREGIAMAGRLGLQVPEVWRAIERGLVLPIDAKTNVLLKYDGFAPCTEGVCPDSLACFFPLTWRSSPEIERATYRFFLDHIDGYIGYPMLSAPLFVFAARLGDRALALSLLERGVEGFVIDNFRQFDEFGKPFNETKANPGPYLANLGGYLAGCLYGLTGIQVDAGDPIGWPKFPICLPEGWRAIEAVIWVRGRTARLRAEHGAQQASLQFI